MEIEQKTLKPACPAFLLKSEFEEFLTAAKAELTEEKGVRHLLELLTRACPQIRWQPASKYMVGLLLAAFPDCDFGPLAEKFQGDKQAELSHKEKIAIASGLSKVAEGEWSVAQAVLQLAAPVGEAGHKELEATQQARLESATTFLLTELRKTYPGISLPTACELAAILIQELGLLGVNKKNLVVKLPGEEAEVKTLIEANKL